MDTKQSKILRPAELLAYPNTTFHITNHALDDMYSFADRVDKKEFLHRFERHLGGSELRDPYRRPFPKYIGEVQLLGYCVLDNHFHLIVHQRTRDGVNKLMRSVTISYSKYFNRRYGRRGPVFQSEFRAVPILDHQQAKRTIAYVHLNHEVEKLDYEFCSHDYYLGKRRCDWLDVDLALGVFGGRDGYLSFMAANGDRILEEKAKRRSEREPARFQSVPRGPATHAAGRRK